MFEQIVILLVKPEDVTRFEEAAKDNALFSRQEPGCVRFDLYRVSQENKYVLREVFEDEAALEDHRKTEHYQRFMAAVPAMLQADPSRLVLLSLDVAED